MTLPFEERISTFKPRFEPDVDEDGILNDETVTSRVDASTSIGNTSTSSGAKVPAGTSMARKPITYSFVENLPAEVGILVELAVIVAFTVFGASSAAYPSWRPIVEISFSA